MWTLRSDSGRHASLKDTLYPSRHYSRGSCVLFCQTERCFWSWLSFSSLHGCCHAVEKSGSIYCKKDPAWNIILSSGGEVHMTGTCPQRSMILDVVDPNWNDSMWLSFLPRRNKCCQNSNRFYSSLTCEYLIATWRGDSNFVGFLQVEGLKIMIVSYMFQSPAFPPNSMSFLLPRIRHILSQKCFLLLGNDVPHSYPPTWHWGWLVRISCSE